jgi:hypothetical protein
MQVDLNLERLTNLKLQRLVNLLEGLADSGRSEAFNHFLFWTAREVEREMRVRFIRLSLHHVVSVDLERLRPGEVVFLQHELREWGIEFGAYALRQLIDALDSVGGAARAQALAWLESTEYPPGRARSEYHARLH